MSTNVLVLGATGFIGLSVAAALRRAGYRVHGLVRSPAKAPVLKKLEIIPVFAEQGEFDKYREVLQSCAVVIDAIGFNELSDKTMQFAADAHRSRVETHGASYKPLYIFTSGIMTYGKASMRPVDETTMPQPVSQSLLQRQQFEEKVLANKDVHGCVIRPGWVYGGDGGPYLGMFFGLDPAAPSLKIVGRRDRRWSWVHVDDLAEAYVSAVKKGAKVVGGELFNVAPFDNPTYEEIVLAAAASAGWKGTQVVYEAAAATEKAQQFEVNVIVNAAKARNVLGWEARHIGFLAEMDLYYQNWLAAKDSKQAH
jgi:nucleoside-diphosphate-sugar epimerase